MAMISRKKRRIDVKDSVLNNREKNGDDFT